MTTLTPTRLAAMPRVNLLPPEIAEAARLKRLKSILLVLLLAVTGLVVLGFLMVSGQIGAAEDDLAVVEAEGVALQNEVATYAEVPQVYGAVRTAQTNLVTASAPEIRWSFYLNDLSLTIPSTSRIVSMTAVNQLAAAQITGPTAETTVGVTPLGATSVGSVAFSSRTTDLDAIASWLQSLARQDGYIEPTVESAVKAEVTDAVGEFYDVESSTQMSADAVSGRFAEIANGE
jgi:Tfp pilus assembly protein PilN